MAAAEKDKTEARSMMRRRTAVQGLAGTAALLAAGCATTKIGAPVPHRHGSVRGYRGLADLPWFELNGQGEPVLARDFWEQVPWGVDFHTHLGMSLMFSPPLDYSNHTEQTGYLIDCDEPEGGCELAFDDYLNKIATPELLQHMEEDLVAQGLRSSPRIKTQTPANLVDELNEMKMGRAVLLAVAPRLPFRNNPTDAWLQALAESEHKDRFVLFAGIGVRDSGATGQVRQYHSLGARGIKLHPPMQHFRPDEPAAMEVYEVCRELDLPVFFHAGRAGIEPKYSRQFAEMKNYIGAVREFPDVRFVFGHAGARDWREAMKIAAAHDNVWLEIEGQGVYELREILGTVGSEKMLFGSDWPFYPLAATMARVLIATENDAQARDRILAHNGRRLLRV